MKIKTTLRLPAIREVHWHSAWLLEKIGVWPLVSCLLPIVLALFWGLITQVQNTQLQVKIASMQQQLSEPLPLQVGSESQLAAALSVTEYQQVKTLFDILSKYHMQVESGNYHFTSAEEEKEKALRLSIPLRGRWLPLAQALQDIARVLPVEVESIGVSRTRPDTGQLSITLQLTLHRGPR
ncbi:hypothetical protein [Serratia sp. AKBS12]|uniref:hypothetical protein n=1 Tax=Serratia sp. AKBS12 TaxID=2974597 RepID=UPI0021653096|nr:hypothetical protein [Serratia sp. AKBS12]MCS3407101.1 hypothetical protein [Serratia sp. AKBS12]HEI8868864.1 hypothetical protein [Serratia odorifera]